MVSRVQVHVVSHYRSRRTEQLTIVLEAMLGWRNCIIDLIITSNVDTYEASGFLRPYVAAFEDAGHHLALNVVRGLDNPRMLTWEHKRYLEPWVKGASPGEDFFLWIEDDIRITNDNIVYATRAVRALKPHGLVPGFIRYETKGDELRLVDITEVEGVDERTVLVDGREYHACRNPYWAGSILDRDLALEYLASRSFTPESSEFVGWNIQERAAMGLTWENPEPGLGTRVVIPLRNGLPDPMCLVWHCSNSYSQEDHPLHTVLTLEQGFRVTPFHERVLRRIRRALARSWGRRAPA